MSKPIVVCGVDFSGTSMLAGMLHAAGVDMGDVESEEDVAQTERPIRYRMFEDKKLNGYLRPLARDQINMLPDISPAWLERLYIFFLHYLEERNQAANGKRWGVKNNGLLFLAMHERFHDIPVQWVSTYRPLEESMDSAFRKIGNDPRWAAELGIEYLAWTRLVVRGVHYPWEFAFNDMLNSPHNQAIKLCEKLRENPQEGISLGLCEQMSQSIDPKNRGVIPWHGSLQPQP